MRGLDLDAVSAEIAAAAAAEILPRFQNLQPHEQREKGPNDLITIADEAMERRLTLCLPDFFAADVLGEEAAAADPGRLARLRDPQPLWIIDPVDGTGNFAAGRRPFAVIVALVADDRVEAGWIHDPLGGEMIAALRGGGAWREGSRLRIPPPGDPVIGSISRKFLNGDQRAWADRIASAFVLDRGRFCAGAAYAGIATGARHFAAFRRLMPWDHAAGALIVQEAGGVSALTPDGGAYRPSLLDGALLSAANAALWRAVTAAGDAASSQSR